MNDCCYSCDCNDGNAHHDGMSDAAFALMIGIPIAIVVIGVCVLVVIFRRKRKVQESPYVAESEKPVVVPEATDAAINAMVEGVAEPETPKLPTEPQMVGSTTKTVTALDGSKTITEESIYHDQHNH